MSTDNHVNVESILEEFKLEMKEVDIRKYDGDSAGRSQVTENQR